MEIIGNWKISYPSVNQPDLKPEWEIPLALREPGGLESALISWEEIPGMSERFTGFLEYTKTFNAEDIREKTFLDLGQVNYMAEVWLNDIHIGRKLWMPYRFDISSAVRKGENHLRIRIGNRVDNYYSIPVASGLLGPVILEKQGVGL